MSTSVRLQPLETVSDPAAKPLDMEVWQAWLQKCRAQERRSAAANIKAIKWISIAGLLVVAGMWNVVTPCEVAIKFFVTACAILMMFHEIHARHYFFAPMFGALALLYNPVAPMFSFAGDWQRAFVVVSTIPFIASLTAAVQRRDENPQRTFQALPQNGSPKTSRTRNASSPPSTGAV